MQFCRKKIYAIIYYDYLENLYIALISFYIKFIIVSMFRKFRNLLPRLIAILNTLDTLKFRVGLFRLRYDSSHCITSSKRWLHVCFGAIYFVRALNRTEISASVVGMVYSAHIRCMRFAGIYLTCDTCDLVRKRGGLIKTGNKLSLRSLSGRSLLFQESRNDTKTAARKFNNSCIARKVDVITFQ